MNSSQWVLSTFQLAVALIGAALASFGALAYFRRVHMERPAIGKFNGRDITILFFFLMILPAFYLVIPRWALETLLVITYMSALSIGFGKLLSPPRMWLLIGVLIGADLWMGQHLLGTVVGWQIFWAENSLIVLIAAISVANLYAQGGMQLRHVAWFAAALAVYDSVFSIGFPITNLLVRDFVGYPLFPAMGMRISFNEAIVGLGDLLVYAAFTVCAWKAYGRKALRLAVTLILIFGAAMPTLSGLLINYIDARADVIIPAQTWFGPAALIGYLWLRRHYGPERTMKQYLESTDVVRQEPPATPTIPTEPDSHPPAPVPSGSLS
jgi:hypothetical protein